LSVGLNEGFGPQYSQWIVAVNRCHWSWFESEHDRQATSNGIYWLIDSKAEYT